MRIDEIIPALFLIAVLLYNFPIFLKSNLSKKQFFINLSFWTVIVLIIVIIINILTR